MNTTIADERIPDIHTAPHAMIRQQVHELFDWVDHFLDVYRSRFVFREPTQEQLAQHKQAFQLGIRTCLAFNALIADPEFNEPELAARLQVRVRQLQDAYDTFHDASLSDEQAGKILKEVFPE